MHREAPLEQYIVQVILELFIVQVRQSSMRVISFSDARNKLKSVLDQVVSDADYTVITRRDSEDAVVMSLDQFNGLMETVHLLKSPANAAHLSKSIKQYRAGKTKQHGLTDD
ncbi:MAG: antitoxin YefM [Candidatus Azotimanducaceae bacterium]|jgi:antitoxin YefM